MLLLSALKKWGNWVTSCIDISLSFSPCNFRQILMTQKFALTLPSLDPHPGPSLGRVCECVWCGKQGDFKDPPRGKQYPDVLCFTLASRLERPSWRATGTGDATGDRGVSRPPLRGEPRARRRRSPSGPAGPGRSPRPRHLRPGSCVPAPRPAPAPRPRPRPAVPPSGVTGAPAPAARPWAQPSRQRAHGKGASEPRAERAAPGEAAFLPAGGPQRDRDAAPRPGSGAGEGPGAAGGGSPLRALAALEPRLDLLLGARRLPGGLGWGPAPLLLRPPASSLPGGEPHLVLYLEFAGEGEDGAGGEGRGGRPGVPPCRSLLPSLEEGGFRVLQGWSCPPREAGRQRVCGFAVFWGMLFCSRSCFEGSEGLCGALFRVPGLRTWALAEISASEVAGRLGKPR